MARTDPDSVKAILLRQYDTLHTPDLTAFIRSANNLTNRLATGAVTKGIPLSDAELTDIETWLAAHYYGVADQMLQAKNTQSSGGTFQGKTDMGLRSTIYGQQAIALDISGYLNAISQGNRPGGFWLGTKDPDDGSKVNVNDT